MSMPLALSTFVLSVNGAQFLNITFLFLLPGSAPSPDVFGTVIVPLNFFIFLAKDKNS